MLKTTFLSLLAILVILLCTTCKKEEIDAKIFFEVKTLIPNDQMGELNEIELMGSVIFDDNKSDAIKFGFLYSSTNSNPSFENREDVKQVFATQKEDLEEGFNFTVTITDFNLKRPLYVAAFAQLEDGGTRKVNGNVVKFIPGDELLLYINSTKVQNRKTLLESSVFNLESLYNATAIQHGHVYAALEKNNDPRVDGSDRRITKLDKLNDDGEFTDTLVSLKSNTTYVVRPYLQVVSGMFYHGDTIHIKIKDTWTRLANLEVGLKEAIAVTNGNKAYFGLGCNAPFCRSTDPNLQSLIWEFDPSQTPSSSLLSDATQEIGLPLKEGATAFSLDGLIYLGFGKAFSTDATIEWGDFWVFDPKETNEFLRWNGLDAPEELRRSHGISFIISNKAYVGLGQLHTRNFDNSGDTIIFKNDFYEFDPSKIESGENAWSRLTDFPLVERGDCSNVTNIGRREAVAFGLNGMGYVATGFYNGLSLGDFWKFDPNTNNGKGEWICIDDFPLEVRSGATAFVIEDKAYLCTGEQFNNTYHTDLWEFDEATTTWKQKANFPGIGRRNAIGFSIRNKGYLLGGWRRVGTNTGVVSEILPDIWEYTPEAN